MNIDIQTDLVLRLETIKSLLEHLLVIDEEEYEKMMNPSREQLGFTISQRVAIENCLEDIFNDSDNFVNITNYRKEIYDFRMLQIEGTISSEEFESKMQELEIKYPFSIENEQDEEFITKIDLRYKKITNCINDAEDVLIDMIKDSNFCLDTVTIIFYKHINKYFE